MAQRLLTGCTRSRNREKLAAMRAEEHKHLKAQQYINPFIASVLGCISSSSLMTAVITSLWVQGSFTNRQSCSSAGKHSRSLDWLAHYLVGPLDTRVPERFSGLYGPGPQPKGPQPIINQDWKTQVQSL